MNASVLTINAGSSSIKFTISRAAKPMACLLTGRIERIGLRHPVMTVTDAAGGGQQQRRVRAPDHTACVAPLLELLKSHASSIGAIGHRVVHGGPHYREPQLVTDKMLDELLPLRQFDPEHMPAEIALIREFGRRFPGVPQIACFDTAFHHDMPRVAKLLPLPRRYDRKGVRRYGFHGLSYTYLMRELRRVAGAAAQGKVILAHLGNGASMAAVRGGRSIDTTMAFTPTAGLVMSTRSGDLDPGVFAYLMRTEGMTAKQFTRMINAESGLLGISESSPDVRDLLKRERRDVRAAEALALFCYQARRWIGALAAALNGLDTLVFAGGIGENSPVMRARICDGLGFLGLRINPAHNRANAPVISRAGSKVTVRVIHTNEELVIALAAAAFIKARKPKLILKPRKRPPAANSRKKMT
jgi:acetate kinase